MMLQAQTQRQEPPCARVLVVAAAALNQASSPLVKHLEAHLQLRLQVTALWPRPVDEHRRARAPRHKLAVLIHARHDIIQLLGGPAARPRMLGSIALETSGEGRRSGARAHADASGNCTAALMMAANAAGPCPPAHPSSRRSLYILLGSAAVRPLRKWRTGAEACCGDARPAQCDALSCPLSAPSSCMAPQTHTVGSQPPRKWPHAAAGKRDLRTDLGSICSYGKAKGKVKTIPVGRLRVISSSFLPGAPNTHQLKRALFADAPRCVMVVRKQSRHGTYTCRSTVAPYVYIVRPLLVPRSERAPWTAVRPCCTHF